MDETITYRFNKIVQGQSEQFLRRLLVIDKLPYKKGIQYFRVINQKSNKMQLYILDRKLSKIPNDIVFLETSPKIVIYVNDQESYILEQGIYDTLYDYMVFQQNNNLNHLSEQQARKILKNVNQSLSDYIKHKFHYNTICPQNIVMINNQWNLSLTGFLLNINNESEEYSNPHLPEQCQDAFSLGCLLFKMLFGFFPFDKSRKPIQPIIKCYLQYLQLGVNQELLKVYSFFSKLLTLSPNSISILEKSLSGKMTFEEWYSHPFFTSSNNQQGKRYQNLQIKMLAEADKRYYSLILAAIDHKNKNPLERLNQKRVFGIDEESYAQIIKEYFTHPRLKYLKFTPQQANFSEKEKLKSMKVLPSSNLQYFYKQEFDEELDRPTLQLIQLIKLQKKSHPELYKPNNARENLIKLYAFPYIMIFQICRFHSQQPQAIKKIVQDLIPLLLQVSSLNVPPKFKPLHDTQCSIASFNQIKHKYRGYINQLYSHFLSEAIKKYNIQNIDNQQKLKTRNDGLEYYRLCLKLMQLSLIIRKGGQNLNLNRIETSDKKQIQSDLNELLRKYFPNKIQLN